MYNMAMATFKAQDILRETGGILICGNPETSFSGISIDSRKIEPGGLFWAIKGERFDGNDFIEEARSKGAAGIVAESCKDVREECTLIEVASSLEALQSLAAFNRRRHGIPLVAITGSNGKTSTKEILSAILQKRYEVLKNEGNLNNLIGVPLTLLNISSDHEVAVVEMGMNRKGEIRALAAMASPDIGLITNIGEAHLEGLGSIEDIKMAKGELIEALRSEHHVVLNADDEASMDLSRLASGNIVTFAVNKGADVRATEVEVEWGKGTLFILSLKGETIPVLLPTYGIHQLYNSLAAAAVAYIMGLGLDEIRDGLEEYEPYSGRMEIISEAGVVLINDTYNANPPSLRHALETMARLSSGRKIAVLGDMLEMGEDAEKIHFDTGSFAFSQGIDLLLTLGPLAKSIVEGAVESGMARGSALSFTDKGELNSYLRSEVRSGDWILIKGSRAMKMEEVTTDILENLKGSSEGTT